MASIHESFDEARWVRRFPLHQLRERARDFVLQRRKEMPGEYRSEAAVRKHIDLMMPKWKSVTMPLDMATCLQLRWESWPADAPEGAVPTDVFVWCEGEPSDRAITKIGGLPYWPQDRQWPDDGPPMPFVGQINFQDSRDIFTHVPGDVLLIFVKDEEFYGPEYFHFEWVNVSNAALVSEPPAKGWWSANAVYAQRMRTWDHPDHGIFQATKIGGIPFEIQGPLELPGKHLVTLHSLGVVSEEPHPFANRDTPMPRTQARFYFGIGDAGSLYMFIDDEGKVHAEDACY